MAERVKRLEEAIREAVKLAPAAMQEVIRGLQALRDLVRTREAAKQDQLRARHRLSKFLLRTGRRPVIGVKAWSQPYMAWLRQLGYEQAAQEWTRLDLLHEVEHMAERVKRLEEAIREADIIMMLRIQTEREKQNLFPSLREYAQYFSLNRKNIGLARKDVLVMHPGPMNRGVEISPDIADGPHSIILDQVTNGVAIRMALLYLLTGGTS